MINKGIVAVSALAFGLALVGCSGSPSDDETVSSSGAALTLSETNEVFVTQWGPTRFNLAGHPDGYDDCGPTSLLMATAYLGYVARPTPADAEAGIRYMRDLINGGPTPESVPTTTQNMLNGLAALRAQAYSDAPTVLVVDDVLTAGGVVLAGGDPKNAWGLSLDSEGHYLHHYVSAPGDVFTHTVVVFGYASDGVRYVVADPLSTIGAIKVTAAQIQQYLSDSVTLDDYTPTVIEVHPPGR
jgi:hypothetical protein